MKKDNANKQKGKEIVVEEPKSLLKDLKGRILFKLPDNSVYYGEVAYLNEIGNIVKNIENLTPEEQLNTKLVRHGEGAQIFDLTSDGKYSSKYEGKWFKDRRTGSGKIVFKDGDIYEGEFYNNLFHGKGKYVWNGKDVYEGDWVEGKMEGEGVFKHREGLELSGMFSKNHYINENGIFVNPFTPKSMIDLFSAKSYDYLKRKQLTENESFSIKNIYKIFTKEFNTNIDNAYKNNKIPLIIFSEE